MSFLEDRGPQDRKTWVSGPWDDEPDYLAWQYEGLDCTLRRGLFGAWCGYVDASRHAANDYNVHGGITFMHAGVIGFDCAHSTDYMPGRAAQTGFNGKPLGVDRYINMETARSFTENLAKQVLARRQHEEDHSA